MKASELLSYLKMKQINGDISELEINYLSQNSRDIQDDTLFFCVVGETVDGHNYAAKAYEAGASLFVASKPIDDQVGDKPVVYVKDVKRAMAMLANAFYGFPSQDLNMIGVTGTNGKTTVTHLIECIYRGQGQKTGLIGTIYRKIDDQIFDTVNTTPDSLLMQATLAQMVEAGVSMCASEVSSHALFQGRTWGVDFNTAVFTNLTHEHLETHKTMEEYGTVKSLLFSQLGNSSKGGRQRFAVINLDDPFSKTLAYRTAAQVVTYSLTNQDADFYTSDLNYAVDGTEFTLHFQNEVYPVTIPLVGEFNVSNTLAALAAAYVNGVDLSAAVDSLRDFKGISGRMQVIANPLGINAIVDYAHTPDGLEKLYIALKQIPHKRLITMIGHDGGNRDNSIRPELGRLALENSDWVVLTTENPRDENPKKIMLEMVGSTNLTNHEYVEDRKEAIYRTVALAEAGDLIVFAGKGHESVQYLNGYSVAFDEAGYVAQALQERQASENGGNLS